MQTWGQARQRRSFPPPAEVRPKGPRHSLGAYFLPGGLFQRRQHEHPRGVDQRPRGIGHHRWLRRGAVLPEIEGYPRADGDLPVPRLPLTRHRGSGGSGKRGTSRISDRATRPGEKPRRPTDQRRITSRRRPRDRSRGRAVSAGGALSSASGSSAAVVGQLHGTCPLCAPKVPLAYAHRRLHASSQRSGAQVLALNPTSMWVEPFTPPG